MTGALCVKKLQSGNAYYYINLRYKDPRSRQWKCKTLSTGLLKKGNRRRAENYMREQIEKYRYLEELPKEFSVSPDVRICEYVDYWLNQKRHDVRQITIEGYEIYVAHIKDFFGHSNPRVIDVTPKMIDEYFRYELRYGKVNQKTKEREPLAVRSVRSHKGILNAVFDQATIDGLIRFNPVRSVVVHGKQNRKYSEEMLFLTEEEVADMLHFLAERYPQLMEMAFFGAYYGLRRSELLGLKWSAIDFVKRRIRISHTVVRSRTVVESDDTKTQAGRRDLNLFDTAEKCLCRIRKSQEENRAFFGASYQNTKGYVFTWADGHCYDPNYITRAFRKAMKAFGRPEITFHRLRHTCASMLINRGWDVKRLQYWLGHTDVQTTMNIYAHYNRERSNLNDNDLSEISLAANDLF